jgi:mRNA interferase MazF
MPVLQWAVAVANLDPVRGSEQHGLRPVLVVSNEEFNQAMPNVTVLPLTSTRRRLYPSEVLLPQGEGGLRHDSIAMAHQIRTIAKERLGDVWGRLDEPSLRRAIQEAIKEHLDLA